MVTELSAALLDWLQPELERQGLAVRRKPYQGYDVLCIKQSHLLIATRLLLLVQPPILLVQYQQYERWRKQDDLHSDGQGWYALAGLELCDPELLQQLLQRVHTLVARAASESARRR